mgnify:CR=1 FL=1
MGVLVSWRAKKAGEEAPPGEVQEIDAPTLAATLKASKNVIIILMATIAVKNFFAWFAGQLGGTWSDAWSALFAFPRLHVALGTAYAGSERRSEYREFEDNKDQPIEQTTTFQRVPVTAGVKAYLTPVGRRIGRFAWVPSRVAPFVGAGGGGMWYRFRQQGDFINTETLIIRTDRLRSSGWTKTAHAFAGIA